MNYSCGSCKYCSYDENCICPFGRINRKTAARYINANILYSYLWSEATADKTVDQIAEEFNKILASHRLI